MYQVNIGSTILYYPGSEEATILDTDLNEEVGLAGEFKFKVPPTNPAYGQLTNGALITILKDGDEFWRGEIRDIKNDFANNADIYVLEDVSWLGDEYIAPAQITNQTYSQRFQAVIATYNASRTADRQFTPGYISNVTVEDLCNWTTEYEWSILDSIRNCICKDNGYVRIRRVTSNGTVTRYIDVVRLEDYGVAASQPIEYGYNLIDYVKDSDYGNLTNVLTPYGEELEDQEVYEDYSRRLQGTTISDSNSISIYGRHAKAVVFDGVTNVNQLNALAQSYLTRYCQPQLTMEVKAVDLAEIENVGAINIGDSVRVIAKPFAIDQRLYLTQIKRDIQNIDKNTITLSGHVVRKSLTSQMIQTLDAIEEIPLESSILKAAKKNALNMLLDETQGGYVVFEYDQTNTKMIAINICNYTTIEGSTKRWRWSQNGFGYMSRTNIQSAWTDLGLAMTMNGEIVADFIKSGTIDTARLSVTGIVSGINSGSSTINGSKITSKTIKNTQVDIASLVSGINSGNTTINGGKITTGTIVAAQIAAGAIIAAKLAAGAVTADKIAAAAITAAKIATGAITADKIAAGAITAAKIAAGAITADKITAGAITAAKLAADAITSKNISGCKITSSSSGKNLLIEGSDIRLYGDSAAGFVRAYEGYKHSSGFYTYEFGISSHVSHAAWNNGGTYLEVSSHNIIEVADEYSDERLKLDIEPINDSIIEELILNAELKQFKRTYAPKKLRFGVIAQKVREQLDKLEIDKECIKLTNESDKGFYEIDYKEYIPMLMRMVQKQQAEIDQLKEEINRLKEVVNG